MSIKAMNWAWSQPLPPTSKLILMAIADSASDAGESWMSNAATARKCCVSTRTVQRELAKFAIMGLLTTEPRYTSAGRQTSNIYRLNLLATSYPDKLSPPKSAALEEDDNLSGTRVTLDVIVGDDIVMSPLEPPKDPSNEPPLQQDAEPTVLHFPRSLPDVQSAAIKAMVVGIPIVQAQELLDELADALESNTIKTNALRWFAGLLRRQRAGGFVPLGAIRIADRRRKQDACSKETQREPKHYVDKELARRNLERITAILRK